MARRQHLALGLVTVMLFLGLTYFMSFGKSSDQYNTMRISEDTLKSQTEHGSLTSSDDSSSSSSSSSFASGISDSILQGGSIAPKLENATAKAELGRASWKLFHTMMARFPEQPTADDSLALKTYIQLFARLYPCGDCASHFQKLLKKYPPQTGSRNAAAGWACFVHNEVNKRLRKPEFDCNKIGDFYDCGCGEEDHKDKAEGRKKDGEKGEKGEELKGREKAEGKGEELQGRESVTLEKEEGLRRGG
ncbi:hypothetical protein N657DRAFT_595145 [Parathielavia appendiculata]|uniref:Sulfhydryl oxidase n=1 Tax=Parathielavia appendiculata TaxID=2587402 RepID=A0AAN6Z465_9PEZI|nr:hypothetical protein N657DRAFT_595145 [Parathielavia appendiculata]